MVGHVGSHDDLVGTVHRCLGVVGLEELLAPRGRHDVGVGTGGVAPGLPLRDSGVALPLGFGLLSTMIACIYALISYRIVELTIPKLLDAGLTKVVIRLRLKAS